MNLSFLTVKAVNVCKFILFSSEKLFVVGASGHRITETLSFKNWKWNILDPYPNVHDVNSVQIISYERSFYIFGGYVNERVKNDILCFKNEYWSIVGSLVSKRINFSVILNANKVYVFGGQIKQKYEICTISNTVDCEQDSSTYFGGSEEPVLLGVSSGGSCELTNPTFESNENKELMILSNATFKEVDHFVSVKNTNYRSDK